MKIFISEPKHGINITEVKISPVTNTTICKYPQLTPSEEWGEYYEVPLDTFTYEMLSDLQSEGDFILVDDIIYVLHNTTKIYDENNNSEKLLYLTKKNYKTSNPYRITYISCMSMIFQKLIKQYYKW